MWGILAFVIGLGFLVLIHELGHYLAARWFRMGIDEFSIGFPPRIKSWISKKTGIQYTLGVIPLGGYVKLSGEDRLNDQDESHRPAKELFWRRPLWQRIVVLLAGVTMNVIAAWMLLSILVPFQPIRNIPDSIRDPLAKVKIEMVAPNSPAEKIGMKKGDILQSFTFPNGEVKDIHSRSDIAHAIVSAADLPVTISWITSEGELQSQELKFESKNDGKLGVGIQVFRERDAVWWKWLYYGAQDTFTLLREMIAGFFTMILSVFSEEHRVQGDVVGPVGIAVIASQAASAGLTTYLSFLAILSLNLCFVNALPLPALDGGRVVAAIADHVFKGKWTLESQARLHQFGFVFLLGLIILLTARDIWNLILR